MTRSRAGTFRRFVTGVLAWSLVGVASRGASAQLCSGTPPCSYEVSTGDFENGAGFVCTGIGYLGCGDNPATVGISDCCGVSDGNGLVCVPHGGDCTGSGGSVGSRCFDGGCRSTFGDEGNCDRVDNDRDGVVDDGCEPNGQCAGAVGCGRCDPSREDVGCCSTNVGGSVNVATGQLAVGPLEILNLRGALGDDLRFTILYHSGYPTTLSNIPLSTASLADSFAGLGMYHSFAVRLEVHPQTPPRNSIVWFREDGRGIPFTLRGRAWVADGGRHTTLVQAADADCPLVAGDPSQETFYTVHEVDDTRYCFAFDGRLLRKILSGEPVDARPGRMKIS